MPTAEISITIDQPVSDVFAYVVDLERMPEWVPVIQEARPISRDMTRIGATYMVNARVMGKEMEIPSEVVGYETDRLYAYRATGAMAYVDTMTFEETETGTRVTDRIVMESEGGFARLLDHLKLMISKRSHQKNLALLKANLEAPQLGFQA